MSKQNQLITRLFKDTLIIFLLTYFTSTIGGVIDVIITGNFLGTEAIAAFGLTMPYQKFAAIFPNTIALGMQILCGTSLGKGDLRKANEIFSLATVTTLGIAIFLAVVTLLFTSQVADVLGAKENLGVIRDLTIDFLSPYSFALPAMMAIAIFTPIMQLDSDRSRAVISTAVLSICNIAGDLLNIFVFDGGLWGIAVATAVSYWIAAGVLILHFFKADSNFALVPENICVKDFPQVISNGFVMVTGRGSSFLRTAFFTNMSVMLAGGVGVATYTVMENFSTFLEIIPKTLGASAQIIAGILIGEQDRNSILRLIKTALKYALILSLVITISVFLALPLIANIYIRTNDVTAIQITFGGIFWFTVGLFPFYTISTIAQYFYQAYGRFKLSSALSVASNIGFIVLAALILTPHFGIMGLWASFTLGQVFMLIAIVVIACKFHGRLAVKLDDYLLLPDDFGVADKKQLDITLTSKEEVLSLSQRAQAFCKDNGIEERRSMFSGICIEEMAGNIIDYGFNDGKKHFVDVRVIIDGKRIIIRIRDDCRAFDPKKQADLYNPEDPAAHIGIRLVRRIATEFTYANVLKINNLIIKL